MFFDKLLIVFAGYTASFSFRDPKCDYLTFHIGQIRLIVFRDYGFSFKYERKAMVLSLSSLAFVVRAGQGSPRSSSTQQLLSS